MNDPVIERVAREDPAAVADPACSGQEAMLARLHAATEPNLGNPLRRGRSRLPKFAGRAGLVVAMLVAAGVAVLVLVVVGRQRASPRLAVHGVHRPGIRVVPEGSILPRSGPVSLLISHGSLWVAGEAFIARVDPRSGAVLARIRVPSSGVGPGQLAVGGGAIWAAYQGVTKVLRIDPTTDRVTATIGHGHRSDGGGVAFADGRVWVSRDGSGPRGDVIAIDPRTNRPAGKSVRVGTGPGTLASGFGSLWVDNTSEPFSKLSRVDPATEQMTYLPFGGQPYTGFGSVWAIPFADDAPIRRYNPVSRSVATINVPRAASMAFGDGHVWAVSYPRSSSSRVFKAIPGTATLTEIDPGTNAVVGTPLRLPGAVQPFAVAVAGDNLWIAGYTDGLLHLKLRG